MRHAGVILLIAFAAFGQSAPPVRTFEVASVKPHDWRTPNMGVQTSGLRLTVIGVNLRGLVMWACNVENFQVSGTARLLGDEDTRWDIAAKAEGDAVPSNAEFRQMLRALLADRFQLAVHRESREMAVYAVVVSKSGPKFKESALEASPLAEIIHDPRNDRVAMAKGTLAELTEMLGSILSLGRPIVDRTGLHGAYSINLTYTPRTRASREGEPDPSDIDIFTAVKEQLGLKLEPQKAMIAMLIVDRAEKPSAN